MNTTKSKSANLTARVNRGYRWNVPKTFTSIAFIILCTFIAHGSFAQNAEDISDWRSREDALNQFAGRLDVVGVIHGLQERLILRAELVLSHQFVRTKKIGRNDPGINEPSEESNFNGYTNTGNRDIQHPMYWGGECNTYPSCNVNGNEIELIYRENGTIIRRFNWDQASKSWHSEK